MKTWRGGCRYVEVERRMWRDRDRCGGGFVEMERQRARDGGGEMKEWKRRWRGAKVEVGGEERKVELE